MSSTDLGLAIACITAATIVMLRWIDSMDRDTEALISRMERELDRMDAERRERENKSNDTL